MVGTNVSCCLIQANANYLRSSFLEVIDENSFKPVASFQSVLISSSKDTTSGTAVVTKIAI